MCRRCRIIDYNLAPTDIFNFPLVANLSIRTSARSAAPLVNVAGWSSPVARQAHNLKVVGSNPTPATK